MDLWYFVMQFPHFSNEFALGHRFVVSNLLILTVLSLIRERHKQISLFMLKSIVKRLSDGVCPADFSSVYKNPKHKVFGCCF